MKGIHRKSVCVLVLAGLAAIASAQNPDSPGQRRRPNPNPQGVNTPTPTPIVSATPTPIISATPTVTGTPPANTPTVTGTPPATTATPTPTPAIGGAPTSTEDCKNDGWRTFTNPRFKNQGDCVSYVASEGRAGGNPKGTPTAVPTRTPTP